MRHLPTAIHREIIGFLRLGDRLEYARVNSLLCDELIKEVRCIVLDDDEVVKNFLSSEVFRLSVLKRIKNPLKQLKMQLFYSPYPFEITVPFHNLRCSADSFLRSKPDNLENLVLYANVFRDVNQNEVLNEVSKILNLKSLKISNFRSVEGIPSMPPQVETLHVSNSHLPLTSLNISQFYHLRCLKLEKCESVVDVSSLGHIYELNLIECPYVKDISPLNHNTIITIESSRIEDYSRSFEYSKEINLILNYSFTGIPINLNRLKAVRSLKIDNPNYATTEDVQILRYTSFPSTLKSLHFKHSKLFYQIPVGHSLRELLIEDCPRFSLANIENIPSLTVHNCHQITDWKPLSEILNVSMGGSPDFIPFQVENVKVLKMEMSLRAFSNCVDLQNITHLKLFPHINIVHPVFIERLTATSLLKELEIEVDRTSPEINIFVSSLKQLTHIPRIVMSVFFTNRYTKGFIDFYRLTVSELKDYFALEAISASPKIVLLPKINHKVVEKKLNCQTL